MKIATANIKLRKRGVGRIAGTFGFLLVVSLVASLGLPALAAPVWPHQFYGNVTMTGGAPAPEGTVVSARIGGVEYAATTVDSLGRYGHVPVWKVPGDDPQTPEKEGGVAGEIVKFYVGGVLAAQSEFEMWGITELDLAVAAGPSGDAYVFKGYVYDDDTGVGIEDVTVKLYRWIGGEWLEIQSTVTSNEGYFGLWAPPTAGEYAVVETTPAGYTSTRAWVAPGFNGEVVDDDRVEFDHPPMIGIVGPSLFYDVRIPTPTPTPTRWLIFLPIILR